MNHLYKFHKFLDVESLTKRHFAEAFLEVLPSGKCRYRVYNRTYEIWIRVRHHPRLVETIPKFQDFLFHLLRLGRFQIFYKTSNLSKRSKLVVCARKVRKVKIKFLTPSEIALRP